VPELGDRGALRPDPLAAVTARPSMSRSTALTSRPSAPISASTTFVVAATCLASDW
jgi:hypothetical protein